MQLSYWELKIGLQGRLTVVGSGIVGPCCFALEKYRKVKY
jgi:hypothetical protein